MEVGVCVCVWGVRLHQSPEKTIDGSADCSLKELHRRKGTDRWSTLVWDCRSVVESWASMRKALESIQHRRMTSQLSGRNHLPSPVFLSLSFFLTLSRLA